MPFVRRLELADFEFDDDESIQAAMVEEEVDVVVVTVEDEVLLPGEKGEVAPHLQDEFLQFGEDRVLQILFAVGVLKSQKRKDIGVPEGHIDGHLSGFPNRKEVVLYGLFRFLRDSGALVEHGILSFPQDADGPSFVHTERCVEFAFERVFDR